jgi:solute carrier family 39 (zinc transporter), member 7
MDAFDMLEQIADLQKCEAVQNLGALKEDIEAGESPVMRKVFNVLFPFSSAGWNAGE